MSQQQTIAPLPSLEGSANPLPPDVKSRIVEAVKAHVQLANESGKANETKYHDYGQYGEYLSAFND